MSWRIATFNANSIRTRLHVVLNWLQKHRPDALCLQETKVQDPDFPVDAFRETGYQIVYHGQKSYNGVALATLRPPDDVRIGFDDGEGETEARILTARVDGIFIVNTYVPQGREPDTEFFQAKIRFFERLKRFFQRNFTLDSLLAWAGDFNVAPEPTDVFDPDRLRGHVGFHPDEHRALGQVKDWGFTDVFRKHNPDPKQYTFWDYRLPKSFERNLGWRLDHIWTSRALTDRSVGAWIDREPRGSEKPSDHTFLIADFDLERRTS
ncbi:MAG: exodeoxyribonuclease III [Deltaproteobacteria bacterium]|nr:exodeoxyribonuclease III [Deltaproteobacteria bacterium]